MSLLVHYFACDAEQLGRYLHALRRQQEELNDETEWLFDEAVSGMTGSVSLSNVGEEALEALAAVCGTGGGVAGRALADLVEEVGGDGVRVLRVRDDVVRTLAGAGRGEAVAAKWLPAARKVRGRSRAVDDAVLTAETAGDLCGLCAAALTAGCGVYLCVHP